MGREGSKKKICGVEKEKEKKTWSTKGKNPEQTKNGKHG